MNQNTTSHTRPDRQVYVDNRGKFPLEELRKYGSQWVAWSADGSAILAHDRDLLVVARQIKRAGLASAAVVLERIPAGGEVTIL